MSEDLSGLHWTELRKRLQDAGMEYKGKEQAVKDLAALESKPAGSAPAPVIESAPPKAKGALDTGKPFGMICGEMAECPSARYTQGGSLFNSEGQKVG